MKPLSAQCTPEEQEYNFKVKVNYHNGAVVVQGPTLLPHRFSQPHPQIQVHPQRLLSSPQHYSPIIPQAKPLRQIPISPQLEQTSSVPQILYYDSYGKNLTKTNSTSRTENSLSGSFELTRKLETIANQPSFSTMIQNEDETEIDCVICERKFRIKDFDLHLELHRNSKKKAQTYSLPTFTSPPIENIEKPESFKHEISKMETNRLDNSIAHSNKPEFLYSFQKNENPSLNESICSNRSTSNRPTFNQNPSFRQSQVSTPNSSFHSSQQLINNSMSREQNQNLQINPGIRYLANPFNSNVSPTNENNLNFSSSSHGSNKINGSIQFKNNSHKISLSRSGKSSEVMERSFQRSFENNNGEQVCLKETQINSKGINPFALIEQNESKIYEYFPEPGHYSISQHRVGNRPDHLFMENGIGHTSLLSNHRHKECDTRSECSESSISSIKSSREPLESMSKDSLVRTYHSGRNKLNLSNIVGMSEALAREGMISTPSSRPSLQNLSHNKSHFREKKERIISSSNMFKTGNEGLDFGRNFPTNLEMISVQNRQVYRGTQVGEEDLREMDSLLNMTRSSRSSTKTKLPKNYLAVNDFISSSQVGV